MVNDSAANALDGNVQQDIELAKPPVKCCTVTLSDVIHRGKRLEAGAYDMDAKAAERAITVSKYGSVRMLVDDGFIKGAEHAPRFKRKYVDRNYPGAVGFLGSSEMLDTKPVPVKFITRGQADALKLFAKPGDVLLSCSGTIGNIGFVSQTLSAFALSQHIIKIDCPPFGGYLYACLKHPCMQRQLQSLVYGAVVQEIEPEHLRNVCIPNAPERLKQRISDLIERSYALRDESNRLIDEATAMLVKELQLPDIRDFDVSLYKKDAGIDTFSVRLSDMAGRADASYHVPVVDAIVEHLNKYAAEVTNIGDARISSDIILAGVFKRTYVERDHGYTFLGGKEITQLNPKIEKYLSKSLYKKRYEKELKVTENTILVTDRGTIGTAALVPKHWDGYAVSQNVLKLIPANDQIAGYIYIFLNSVWGKILVRRQTYGSVVDMIDNHSLAAVEIPLLKHRGVQREINDLALAANEKRYEAYKLEQQALQIMDKEVIFAK